jgi:serine/threonine-protein kinase
MSEDSPAGGVGRPLKLGKYEVLSHIAAGGMAAVYRAVDPDTGQMVALKVLPTEFANNPTLLTRFEREARTMARFHHDNIVDVYELGEVDGTHYIVMEYVDGIDLYRYIAQRKQLEIEEALDILAQATRALDHAHLHGVVHRDVKPSNLLLTEVEGRRLVKLTDLGLALDRRVDDETRLTRPNTTLGTVDYMAPEQARGSHLVDIRSDLYALGCTFYHMLTGRPPFPDGAVADRLYKHVHVMAPNPREFNRNIPEEVLNILGRLLHKKPEDRYQTPAELILDLERLSHQLHFSQPLEILTGLAVGTAVQAERRTGLDRVRPLVAPEPSTLVTRKVRKRRRGPRAAEVQPTWSIVAEIVTNLVAALAVYWHWILGGLALLLLWRFVFAS